MSELINIINNNENNDNDCYFKMPKIFWFKYLFDRQQYHYAVILKQYNLFVIYFINQYGQIFDKLLYKNYKVAKRLLRKNKFVCSSNKKCDCLPKKPIYKNLMNGKKTAPYSKGTLWLVQERYNNPNLDEKWKHYQEWASDYWYDWNNYYKSISSKNFYNLINEAEIRRICRLEITGKRIYTTDIELTLKSKFGESQIWLASSMNNLSNIWLFLEAVIRNTEPYVFFYCDEEGADTFFYVKKYQNERLYFVHLTNNNTKEWKVVQKITTFQDIFIYAFYKAINSAIKNGEYVLKNNGDYDNFIDLVKGSTIVKTYLQGSG